MVVNTHYALAEVTTPHRRGILELLNNSNIHVLVE